MEIQEIKNLLGKNIKYFRFRKQISQSALAEKADISVTFLSNIERGKMFPKVETLSRITKSLDVEVFELFRADLVPEDNKETINRLSEDITKNVRTCLISPQQHWNEGKRYHLISSMQFPLAVFP